VCVASRKDTGYFQNRVQVTRQESFRGHWSLKNEVDPIHAQVRVVVVVNQSLPKRQRNLVDALSHGNSREVAPVAGGAGGH
jgi:hypothetical protein